MREQHNWRRAVERAWSVVILAGVTAACQSTTDATSATAAQAAPPPPQSTPALQRGRTMIDAKAMSLRELVDQADRIVVGNVEAIETSSAQLSESGESASAMVRDVTIRVAQALKGSVTVGQQVKVRQLASLGAPLATGETVMWFLPADSSLGLTQPLGMDSGDFRVDLKDPAKPAVNLRQNEGLWEDSLWAGDGFERARVLGEATAALKLSTVARTRIDNAGKQDPLPGGVPLDLLVSATLSQVKR